MAKSSPRESKKRTVKKANANAGRPVRSCRTTNKVAIDATANAATVSIILVVVYE